MQLLKTGDSVIQPTVVDIIWGGKHYCKLQVFALLLLSPTFCQLHLRFFTFSRTSSTRFCSECRACSIPALQLIEASCLRRYGSGDVVTRSTLHWGAPSLSPCDNCPTGGHVRNWLQAKAVSMLSTLTLVHSKSKQQLMVGLFILVFCVCVVWIIRSIKGSDMRF